CRISARRKETRLEYSQVSWRSRDDHASAIHVVITGDSVCSVPQGIRSNQHDVRDPDVQCVKSAGALPADRREERSRESIPLGPLCHPVFLVHLPGVILFYPFSSFLDHVESLDRNISVQNFLLVHRTLRNVNMCRRVGYDFPHL
ncbi:putative coatomer protein complex, gamma sub-unit, partial [Toxoplasma gondii ARI]